jgi:hypothetical protein
MSKQKKSAPLKDITGRDNMILADALAYALEALNRLPEKWQPASDMLDMEVLLAFHAGRAWASSRIMARAVLSQRGLTLDENGELAVKSPEGVVIPFRVNGEIVDA